ncbi:MAG: DinB family protein [Cyclobacteriaceae bacterium]|nr:DinB family protein [Cyclobacteriaceae bacterium]
MNIKALARNKDVFKSILQNRDQEQVVWKPSPDKWCVLEVLYHLIVTLRF